jgi:hypothetical protein
MDAVEFTVKKKKISFTSVVAADPHSMVEKLIGVYSL